MEIGAQVPAWLWDVDAAALRDFAVGAEAIGLDFLFVTDHIAFAYPLPDRPAVGYSGAVVQHEALTTLAFLAACTSRITLQTTVLVLPQREPVLVAKQVAEIDLLSAGRMRLGVGAGWNATEFSSVGAPFDERGARLTEGVRVLRACWANEPVTFDGRHSRLREMSVLPKPSRPGGPPVLFGGSSAAAERRAARMGDGWMGLGFLRPEQAGEQIARIRSRLVDAGRDPEAFPFQWTTSLRDTERTATRLMAYRDVGAERLGVTIPEQAKEPQSIDAYLKALGELRHALTSEGDA